MNERLKEIRKALGLTLDKFGEKVGLRKSSLSQIERGTNNVTNQLVVSVCREFNVNEQWLRTGEGEMFVQMSMEEELAKELGKLLTDDAAKHKRAIIAAMLKMDDSAWDGLDKLLDEVIEQRKKLT